MGLPSKRRTKSSKLRRASHFAIKKTVANACLKCAKPVLPHRACDFCGTYRGRQVVETKTKALSVKQKAQARREATRTKTKAKAKTTKKSS